MRVRRHVSARWAAIEGEAWREPARERAGLSTLLALTAAAHPDRIALVDPADKPRWSGRPAITWTYAAAAEIVERLSQGIRGWRLAPGSRIGLCLPGTAESALTLLAVEAAGHLPCLLPISWGEDKLAAAARETDFCAVITQSRIGATAPVERLRAVAARLPRLHHVAAFGPDVPNGVINLDRMVLEKSCRPLSRTAGSASGIVTFANGDPGRPILRSQDALVAAGMAHLVSARVAPGERILSLFGPHDLRGLGTGLAAALVAGGSLETLPLFESAGFSAALARAVPTHLVAPAFLENALAGCALPETLASISLVHRAPVRFPGRAGQDDAPLRFAAVIDVVAFDETALLSGRRGGAGDVALTLGWPTSLPLPASLMAMRRGPDGRIDFRGRACTTSALPRGALGDSPVGHPGDAWRPTSYEASLREGLATGIVTRAGRPQANPTNIFATA